MIESHLHPMEPLKRHLYHPWRGIILRKEDRNSLVLDFKRDCVFNGRLPHTEEGCVANRTHFLRELDKSVKVGSGPVTVVLNMMDDTVQFSSVFYQGARPSVMSPRGWRILNRVDMEFSLVDIGLFRNDGTDLDWIPPEYVVGSSSCFWDMF